MILNGQTSCSATFSVADVLNSINNDLSVIDERLERLLKAEIPDHMRPYLKEASIAKYSAQQSMLKLVLYCLKNGSHDLSINMKAASSE